MKDPSGSQFYVYAGWHSDYFMEEGQEPSDCSSVCTDELPEECQARSCCMSLTISCVEGEDFQSSSIKSQPFSGNLDVYMNYKTHFHSYTLLQELVRGRLTR